MLSVTQPDLLLDCKNLLCPIPILKISQAIKLIGVGQTIMLETTDPGSRHDLPAWARRTGHELIETEIEGVVNRFLVRRTQ